MGVDGFWILQDLGTSLDRGSWGYEVPKKLKRLLEICSRFILLVIFRIYSVKNNKNYWNKTLCLSQYFIWVTPLGTTPISEHRWTKSTYNVTQGRWSPLSTRNHPSPPLPSLPSIPLPPFTSLHSPPSLFSSHPPLFSLSFSLSSPPFPSLLLFSFPPKFS